MKILNSKKIDFIRSLSVVTVIIFLMFGLFAVLSNNSARAYSGELALIPGYEPVSGPGGQVTGYQPDPNYAFPSNSAGTGGSSGGGNSFNVNLAPSKTLSEASTFKDVLYIAISYIDKAVYVIISLSILSMVYGIYKHFIHNGDSPASRAEGGKYVLWGIFAIFVILSFWGLVSILVNTFGVPGR
jgi:hypothetical protein